MSIVIVGPPAICCKRPSVVAGPGVYVAAVRALIGERLDGQLIAIIATVKRDRHRNQTLSSNIDDDDVITTASIDL